MIDAATVRDRFSYDEKTGIFIRRVSSGSCARGSVAGTIHSNGKRYIQIDEKLYFASRLAWLYMTGYWPKLAVNHRNLNRSDDSWENLREATPQQLSANRRNFKRKLTPKGVHLRPSGRFRARIRVNGALINLGEFSSADLASKAYADAASKHFGDFARLE